jgi:hypothetical protein
LTANGRLDKGCGCGNVVVLPDAYDSPTSENQLACRVAIALLVAIDLCLPIGTVGLGWVKVCRTSMPETAVKEHGNLVAREDHVCSTPQSSDWLMIDAVPETSCEDG